ncbi:trypsin-like peptidase domain-containing protein [Streptomyces sp. MBT65]|uniref:TCP-1/cpn60 chaperonin family protein n=1 Tax=Streptomyces sp. MBT65 TaxID=1488395 RepID=UPI001909C861|nr:TCP-1/cpn60 chaperonin family protein [Streptomyces sp. MBT65]MBK3576291.1 trypsin-like peptidase domain-containing protein [Streptomyces sp. MBT65]
MTSEESARAPVFASALEAMTDPRAGLDSPKALGQALADGECRSAMLERDGHPVASGFLVGPDVLLTTGHTLITSGGGTPDLTGMTAVFDYVEGSPGSLHETGVRVSLDQLLQYSPPAPGERGLGLGTAIAYDPAKHLDFALVRLAGTPLCTAGTHGHEGMSRGHYDLLDPGRYDFRGDPLYIFQYPSGQKQKYCMAGGARLDEAAGRVRYRGNTQRGASGGAVTDPRGHLVAMHQSFPDRYRRFGPGENQAIPVFLIARAVRAVLHAALSSPPRPPVPPSAPHASGSLHGAVAQGAVAMADVIGALLGPRASAVTLPGEDGAPVRLVTVRQVVERYVVSDHRHTAGADLVAEAARTTDSRAGDGAATAAVLAAALIAEADRRCALGASPAQVAREADTAMARIRARLARSSEPCTDPRIVAASATPDHELAEKVTAAAVLAGPRGVLVCGPGDSRDVETTLTQGLRIPVGYASPHAVTDHWSGTARLVRPYVLLLDDPVGDARLLRLLSRVRAEGRDLLIATSAHDTGLMRALRENTDGPTPPVIQVAEGPGGRHRLRALAVLTGATLLTSGSGLHPETAGVELLGRARSATVSATETVLAGGEGKPAAIARWIASTTEKRQQAAPSRHTPLDEMLSWLSAQAVCLSIGADSPADLPGRTEAAGRAARAAQAALRSGTVDGGGLALLRCSSALADAVAEPGATAVRAALAAPFRLLARSMGMSGAETDRFVEHYGEAPGREAFPGPPLRDATEIVGLTLDAAMNALDAFLFRTQA